MENATNALIMAAGVLIGVMILSLAVYLFTTFGVQAQKANDRHAQQEVARYNAQYNMYVGREDLTIYDVISIVNLAHQNNVHYEGYSQKASKYEVRVLVGGNDWTDLSEAEKQKKIEEQSKVFAQGEPPDPLDVGEFKITYTMQEPTYHLDGGRIRQIRFTKNRW